jgi:dTDP-3,4-didehydro-2,6-dideoxy-alpha-D-glucose 3-reductase
MNLLLLGLSSLAKRRILPAAAAAGFDKIEVASRSAAASGWSSPAVTRIYSDYIQALQESRAELVYITTVNSLHEELAEQCLLHGFHVIVDKPAFLSLADTRRLLELAENKRRLLAEATVWQYHPRVAAAIQAFKDAGSQPTRMISAFSFPPLAPTDFRYRAELGGGALWDLGPYAMTPGRVFFDANPCEIVARITSSNGSVETSFSLLGLYPDGRSLVGSFGYNTGYINRLELAGPGLTASMDRVFSPPATLSTELQLNDQAGPRSIAFPPADNFALFLQEVIRALEQNSYTSLAKSLLLDAENYDLVRRAAGIATKG